MPQDVHIIKGPVTPFLNISSLFHMIDQIVEISLQETTHQTYFTKVLHAVCVLLDYDVGVVYQFGGEAGLGILRYQIGLSEEIAQRLATINLNAPPYSQIISKGKPQFSDHNLEQYPLWKENGILALASIPLICEIGVVGILNVGNKRHRTFSEEERQFLGFISKECGVSVYRFLIQESLRKSREDYHNLIQQSYDGILLIDEEGKLKEWSQGLERISGWSRDEVIGQYSWDVQYKMTVRPDKSEADFNRFREALKKIIETGHAPWKTPYLDTKLLTKTGGLRNIQQLTFPLKTEKGFMICSILRDVTEQVAANEALKASEEGYRLLFEKASDLIIMMDVTGRVLNISPSVLNLIGLAPKEVEGQVLWDIPVFPNTPREKIIEKIRQGASGTSTSPTIYELLSKTKAGGRIFMEGNTTPIINDGQVTKIIIYAHDVTTRKLEEEKLRQIEQERQASLEHTLQISELKSNLMMQAAHEIKTPLTAIFGWSELLLRVKKEGKSLDAIFTLEDLESIARSAKRLDDIINDFLDVGRIENIKMALNKQDVEFEDLTETALKAVEHIAFQKRISFITDTMQNRRLSVDRRRMEQVMINFLTNAIKYSPEGSHVTIKTDNIEDGLFRFSVIDEGYGFTPQEIPDATKPFSKPYTRQEKKRVIGGTGLGLYICRTIIEQHGGILEILSEGPDRGSEVRVTLPV